MPEGQETQAFTTTVLHGGSAVFAGSDITVHKGFTVGSYPMLSRQQRILKFRCSRQVQLM